MAVQNQVLTEYAAGYTGNQDWSVLDKIAPLVPVSRGVFEYAKYTGGMKQVDDNAGERSPANIVEITETREPGRVPELKLAETLTAREIRDYGDEGTLDNRRMAKVRHIHNSLQLRRAIRLAALMEDTGTITNVAATAAFGAGGDAPLTDVRTKLITGVYNQGGLPPNTLVYPRSVWTDWIATDEVRAEFKSFAIPTPELVANYFAAEGIKQVLILHHSKDTAQEGQTASFSNVWSSSKMWAMHLPEMAEDVTDRSPFKTFYLRDEWNRVETVQRENPTVEDIIEYRSCIQKLTDSLSVRMLTGC